MPWYCDVGELMSSGRTAAPACLRSAFKSAAQAWSGVEGGGEREASHEGCSDAPRCTSPARSRSMRCPLCRMRLRLGLGACSRALPACRVTVCTRMAMCAHYRGQATTPTASFVLRGSRRLATAPFARCANYIARCHVVLFATCTARLKPFRPSRVRTTSILRIRTAHKMLTSHHVGRLVPVRKITGGRKEHSSSRLKNRIAILSNRLDAWKSKRAAHHSIQASKHTIRCMYRWYVWGAVGIVVQRCTCCAL